MEVIHKSTMYIRRIEVDWVAMPVTPKYVKFFIPYLTQVDLLLIHQPFSDYYGTYRAMEEAYKVGNITSSGDGFDKVLPKQIYE